MNNDEIKALLRELKERSDEADEVKGKTVRITLGDEEEKPSGFFRKNTGKKSRTLGSRRKKEEEPSSDAPGLTENPGTDEANRPETAPAEKEKAVKGAPGTLPESRRGQETHPEERREQETLPKSQPKQEAHPESQPEQEAHPESQPEQVAYPESRSEQESPSVKDAAETPKKRTAVRKRSGSGRIMEGIELYFDDLRAKGIGGKELLMIAAGAVLLVMIICAVFGALFGEDKSRNVAADEGLVVTVEREPETWCGRDTVELGIWTGRQIQSVTVNGKKCEFEGKRQTRITCEADSETLEVMVVTEESVMNATVELPMIDSDEPVISVSRENDQVTLNAVDSRSGLAGVYYGWTEGFSNVPQYYQYTGPFTCEPGRIYYYYACDNAGNRTVPVATNMEPARSLKLSEQEVFLFPGESIQLKVSGNPDLSFYNNLKLTNSNPGTVSLEADGTVTALQEGDAVITAEADGLESVSCQISVRSETEITISAIGDCTLGTDVNLSTLNSFDTVQSMYGNTYFFQNVRSILSEDDITFANLEGTLTELDSRENKQYAFKGAPSNTEILQDGSVEVVTLANNHSSDYGAQSLTDTKNSLTEAGIDYCMGDEIAIREVKGVKVALIGIYVLDSGMEKESQVRETIASASRQGADIIAVAFHWGSEKSTEPDETQKSLAHTAIDCGADLVVGHHPHVLQGIEQYQGKYIVYSLANFCFGGNSAPSDTDTMIFQMTFKADQNGTVRNGGINIIPCSITSEAGWNNYQPTPAQDTEAERIMTKIKELSAPFGTTFE